jgi:hypothetical protein
MRRDSLLLTLFRAALTGEKLALVAFCDALEDITHPLVSFAREVAGATADIPADLDAVYEPAFLARGTNWRIEYRPGKRSRRMHPDVPLMHGGQNAEVGEVYEGHGPWTDLEGVSTMLAPAGGRVMPTTFSSLQEQVTPEWVRRNGVLERARQEVARGNRVGIGIPVLAELFFGIELSTTRDANMQRLQVALGTLILWPFTEQAAAEYQGSRSRTGCRKDMPPRSGPAQGPASVAQRHSPPADPRRRAFNRGVTPYAPGPAGYHQFRRRRGRSRPVLFPTTGWQRTRRPPASNSARTAVELFIYRFSKTVSPPMTVRSTAMSLMACGSTFRGSRSRTTKSASLPGSMEPLRSSANSA